MKTFLIKLGWKLIMCLKNQVDRIFRRPLSRRAVVVGKKMSDGDSKKDEAKRSLLPAIFESHNYIAFSKANRHEQLEREFSEAMESFKKRPNITIS